MFICHFVWWFRNAWDYFLPSVSDNYLGLGVPGSIFAPIHSQLIRPASVWNPPVHSTIKINVDRSYSAGSSTDGLVASFITTKTQSFILAIIGSNGISYSHRGYCYIFGKTSLSLLRWDDLIQFLLLLNQIPKTVSLCFAIPCRLHRSSWTLSGNAPRYLVEIQLSKSSIFDAWVMKMQMF